MKIEDVVWKTKTPFASVRRIVQNEKYFFKIKPGLWALNDFKDSLPENVAALIQKDESETKTEKEHIFSHYYYQGLLAEIGNLKKCSTYVPPQDKNKPYLNKKLGEVTSIERLPLFAYQETIDKIKSIDVIWLNQRGYPNSVFEVEHSTTFKNSLIKFNELQDFSTKMFVVAPKVKENEYKSAIDFSVFENIKGRIKFMDYTMIEGLYEHTLRTRKFDFFN
ncbi:MAG: hypothetical protein RBT65_09365 [Methanolobus sp.]|nr:hypothetical protein [Methanolobus sp.]